LANLPKRYPFDEKHAVRCIHDLFCTRYRTKRLITSDSTNSAMFLVKEL